MASTTDPLKHEVGRTVSLRALHAALPGMQRRRLLVYPRACRVLMIGPGFLMLCPNDGFRHMARVVNDRDMVVRAPMPKLAHHFKAIHLTYITRQWFTEAFGRMTWREVPMFVASYVPILDAFADHTLVAYRAHDLEQVVWDGPF